MTNSHNTDEEAYRAEVRDRIARNSGKKTSQGKFGIALTIIIVICFIAYGIFNFKGNTSSSTLSNINKQPTRPTRINKHPD